MCATCVNLEHFEQTFDQNANASHEARGLQSHAMIAISKHWSPWRSLASLSILRSHSHTYFARERINMSHLTSKSPVIVRAEPLLVVYGVMLLEIGRSWILFDPRSHLHELYE